MVKDRINFTDLSTVPPDVSALSKNELCQSMLPSVDDNLAIKHNITCPSLACLLVFSVNMFPFSNTHMMELLKGILNMSTIKQMSSKSEVVC